jgi:hypothetical protein
MDIKMIIYHWLNAQETSSGSWTNALSNHIRMSDGAAMLSIRSLDKNFIEFHQPA